MLIKIFPFLVLIFSFISCSSSIEETREEGVDKEDTYVFDDAPESESEDENESLDSEGSYFLIQIGAFTDKQRAEQFADESKKLLGREIKVSYSSDVNLFVVQLNKKFNTKEEAESVRKQIRENEEFKDAWITTISIEY
jgi:cell division protein FtsN